MKKILYGWQEECLRLWTENGGRGIINVVTGAGKTLLAIAAFKRLSSLHPNIKIKIVVPKAFLVSQWSRAIRQELDVSPNQIGYWYGARKDTYPCIYMIYVINSARYALAKHIADELTAGHEIFLIADECHHYGTSENARIFDFIPFISGSAQYYSMGLSATPYIPNFKNILEPALGREVYHYRFDQALREDIINPFALFHIALPFDHGESEEYRDYSDSLRTELQKLKSRLPHLRGMSGSRFFVQLRQLVESPDEEIALLAFTVQLLFYRRKEVVYLAKSRLRCVFYLLERLGNETKTILFSERIKTAEHIYRHLPERRRRFAGLYHSEMDGSARINALRRFEEGELTLLISCKALDEGLNIPDADAGIVISSTATERQRIQRLGRVLRKREGCAISRLFYLFIADTAEETTFLMESGEILSEFVPMIELTYMERENRLLNRVYDNWAAMVLQRVAERGWDNKKINEAEKLMEKALITCDWLMTEEECRFKIKNSAAQAERNYYTVISMLIEARGGDIP